MPNLTRYPNNDPVGYAYHALGRKPYLTHMYADLVRTRRDLDIGLARFNVYDRITQWTWYPDRPCLRQRINAIKTIFIIDLHLEVLGLAMKKKE